MKKILSYIFISLLITLFWSCQNENLSPTESISEVNTELNKKGNSSALNFNGVDSYVEIPDNSSLDLSNQLTISAWVYFNSDAYPLQYASIVTKGTSGVLGVNVNNNYALHSWGDGRFALTATTTGGGGFLAISDNTPLSPNTWHHVAVTYKFDGATQQIKFYINGRQFGQALGSFSSGPAALVSNSESLTIGADLPVDSEFWYGKIDEVKIWNTVLSPRQIRASRNGSAIPRSSSLVGFWNFNEGSGSTVVQDRSRYHNDGTIVGEVSFCSPGIH